MSNHLPPRLTSGLKRIKSTRVRALLSIGMVFGLGAVGTLAYWTDSATLAAGTFTSGTLDIKLNGSDGPVGTPATFTGGFTTTNMQPGDQKSAAVSVQNAGSIDLTYSATGVSSGTLGSLLTFTVVANSSVSGTGCTAGTTTYNDLSLASAATVIAGPRTILAGQNESVCVIAKLPSTTTTGQNTTGSVTFTFSAKQVGAP